MKRHTSPLTKALAVVALTVVIRAAATHRTSAQALDTLSFADLERVFTKGVDATAEVTVIRSGPATESVTVQYATSSSTSFDTAKAGRDYEARNGVLTFAPGERAQTLDIPLIPRREIEETRMFEIRLSNPMGAQLGIPETAYLYLVNSFRGLAVEPGAISESGTVIEVTVRRTDEGTGPLTVFIDPAAGSATPGVDFIAEPSPLEFAAGESSATMKLTLLNDTQHEGDETVVLAATNGTPRNRFEAVLTIHDDERPLIVDPDFDPGEFGPSDGDFVRLIALPNGQSVSCWRETTVVGGTSQSTSRMVRQNQDGSIDPGFTAPTLVDIHNRPDIIQALAALPDGRVLIGGTFHTVNGVVRPKVALLRADGSLDPGFLPPSTLGSATCLAVQKDGKVVVSGYRNGHNDLFRLNADGTLDGGFNPGPSLDPKASPEIEDIALADDGRIVIAGTFRVGSSTRHVGRLNDDGTVDLGFIVPSALPASKLAVQSDGKVLVASQHFPTSGPRNFLNRLNPDGTMDRTFDADLVSSLPTAVRVQPDGKILVVTPGTSFYRGVYAAGLVRLHPNGTLDQAFPTGIGSVHDIALTPDHAILVAANAGVVTRLFAEPSEVLDVHFQSAALTVAEDVGDTDLVVERSDTSGPLTLGFTMRGESARPGVDFVSKSGRLQFGPGEASRTIPITILNNGVVDGERTFRVVVTNASGTQRLFGPTKCQVTVQNDDRPVEFESPQYMVSEDGGEAVATVLRGTTGGDTFTVDYVTHGGSATEGQDFVATTGTLTFGPGETRKSIRIPILNDALVEGDESFGIELIGPSNGAVLGSQTHTSVTLFDNDIGFKLDGSKGTFAEDAAEVTVDVVIRGDFVLTDPVSVTVETESGSATSGEDFVGIRETLVFAPGETRKSVHIPLINDRLVEGNEYFVVRLNDPVGIPCVTEGMGVPILDNERGYRVERSPGEWQLVIREGSGDIPVSILREGDFEVESSVDVHVAGSDGFGPGGTRGTATPDVDFSEASWTVTFAPGETRREILVHVMDDALAESSETFFINLDHPTGGVPISESTRPVTIQDDDAQLLSLDPDFHPAFPYVPDFEFGGLFQSPDPMLAVDASGGIFMTTSLARVSGEDGRWLVRLRHSGELDPTFQPASIQPWIETILPLPDGSLLIGGSSVLQINSIPVPFVARLEADGSLDRRFAVRLPVGADRVTALARQSDGQLLVAWRSSFVGKMGILRVNPLGAPDLSFHELQVPDGFLYNLSLDSKGRILMCGYLASMGTTADRGLARLNPDGTEDTTFGDGWSVGTVRGFLLLPGDRVLVKVQSNTDNLYHILRLDPNGRLDPSFKPIDDPYPSGTWIVDKSGRVTLVQQSPDDSLFVRRLNEGGSIDTTFSPGTLITRISRSWVTAESDGNWLLTGLLPAVNGRKTPGMVRVLPNAPIPRIELDPVTATRLELSSPTVTLRRIGDRSTPLTILWATDGGTARPGIDYEAASGFVTFAPGEALQDIPLVLKDNQIPEADRTVRLRFTDLDGTPYPPMDLVIADDDLGFLPGGIVLFPNGRTILNVTGYRHRKNALIQRSSDLRDWEDFWYLENTYLQPLDPETFTPGHPRRFYRLVADPFPQEPLSSGTIQP